KLLHVQLKGVSDGYLWEETITKRIRRETELGSDIGHEDNGGDSLSSSPDQDDEKRSTVNAVAAT
ncbi:hypothetical protein PQX77_003043, partial [Marasmius sp. AFHP31]